MKSRGVLARGMRASFSKESEEVRSRNCPSVELALLHAEHARHVAIGAAMATTAVWVRRQRRLLAGLARRCVHDRAALDAYAIRIELWH